MIPTAQQSSVLPDPRTGALTGHLAVESVYAYMHGPDVLPFRELSASMDVMSETFEPWYETQDELMMAADAIPIHPGTSVSTVMLGWPDNYGAEVCSFWQRASALAHMCSI